MFGIIATWRMALEGITEADEMLKNGSNAQDAIEAAIRAVEDFEYYKSVGYGGLPNEDMEVELDAGWMNGDTLSVGAVAAIKDFANPVSIARRLSEEPVNNILVAEGAARYAHKEGFERKNMLTERAKIHYHNRVKEVKEQELKPYSGHDTVGMVDLDAQGSMCAATSTSGLFMKRAGRVGDSPICGSGFYADSAVGGASATGLGEDLMKGCISYEIVRLMKEGLHPQDSPICGSGFYADSAVGGASATGLGEDLMKGCISYEIVRLMKEGLHPQQACEKAVNDLDAKLAERRGKAGDLSVVAMNNKGEWGCATNIEGFSFAVATETLKPTVFLAKKDDDGKQIFEEASKEWMDNYMKTRTAPLVRK